MTATILIPAHNEAQVISSTLSHLVPLVQANWQVVVLCNGCTDATAAKARAFTGVQIIEIDRPSKVNALNVGLEHRQWPICVFLDADINISSSSLVTLVQTVADDEGVHIAGPRVTLDTTGVTWLVRSHLSLMTHSSYMNEPFAGSGVFAIDSEGLERIGVLPEVIADDTYIRRRFARVEMCEVEEATCSVRPPANLRQLMNRSLRTAIGNEQLRRLDLFVASDGSGSGRSRFSQLGLYALRRPGLWPAALAHLLVYSYSRWRSRSASYAQSTSWLPARSG